jgi:hypothetical protein
MPFAPWRSTTGRVVAAVALLGCCYMIAVPPNGGIDEQDHLVRAAATVRGDLDGRGRDFPDDPVRVYDIDGSFKGPQNVCWARITTQDASCMTFLDEVPFAFNGYYPPTYFVVVGGATFVVDGFSAVRGVRLVSLAVTLALLTLGLLAVRRRHGDRATLVAATAITPTVMFLSGVVNPQSFEIAGAFAAWAAMVSVLRGSPSRVERWALVAGGLALVTIRPLGTPMWIVIIAVAGWQAFGFGVVRAALRSRELLAVTGVGVIVAVWTGLRGTADIDYAPYARPLSLSDAVGDAFRLAVPYTDDAIGRLGWLDIPTPTLTSVLWWTILVAGLALLVGRGRSRDRVALGGLAVALWTMQIVITWSQANANGFAWQGRYALALLVGLPFLVLAAAPSLIDDDAVAWRWLGPAMAVGHFGSFYLALRRWTIGTDGPIWFAFDAAWSPPLPVLVVLAVALVACGLLASAGWAVSSDGSSVAVDRSAEELVDALDR